MAMEKSDLITKWFLYPAPPVCSMYVFQTRCSTLKEKKVNFVDEGTE